jgi:two-component system, OmpR family, phosphate regulon sensor histidine kinase PhoR
VFTRPDGRDRHTSLIALLVLLTLLPAACVLWFMNEALEVQSDAVRRSMLEGYRAQLRLVRSRVEAHWQAHAAQINGSGDARRRFFQLIDRDMGDGAILLDEYGRIAFPDRDARATSVAQTIAGELATAEQMPAGQARQERVRTIAGELNDYERPLGADTRVALMGRLRELDRNVMLPTQAALELSTEIARRGGLALDPGVFQQTALRDVWAFTSSDGRTVLLYRTGRIEAMMHDLLHEVQPSGILFNTFAPDEKADMEAVAAGVALPGWQLSFFEPIENLPVDESTVKRQKLAYAAVAASAFAATVLIAVVTGSAFRRQLRLARLKTDLVAAVSHELRTPLASMRVLVDGLLADARLDETKTREYLHLLATENARLTRLIENFLAFSRLERGRERFVFAPVAPAAVVHAAVTAMRERLPRDCDLRIEIASDLPPVLADEGALVSALINLLDNAVKYSPQEKRVVLHVVPAAQGVAFAVQDSGIGIAAREQRRIFRRFYRVDQRLAQETSGVGLGLSIVELIARAHGGSISVESTEGVGSTFTLWLPTGAVKSVTAQPAQVESTSL